MAHRSAPAGTNTHTPTEKKSRNRRHGRAGKRSAQKTYAAKLGVELGLEARHLALHLCERGGRLGHVRGQGGLFLLQLGRRRARWGKEEDLGEARGIGVETARQSTAEQKWGEAGRRRTRGAQGHQECADQIYAKNTAASRVSITSVGGPLRRPQKPKRSVTPLW